MGQGPAEGRGTGEPRLHPIPTVLRAPGDARREPVLRHKEARAIRNTRRAPIRFSGNSISQRGGHVHVRIDRPVYLGLKAYLVGIAPHRDEAELASEVRRTLDFEPYAFVRAQYRAVLRAVNRAWASTGLPKVPQSCLRTRRRVVRPFEPPEGDDPG